jgi:hypothetical protein
MLYFVKNKYTESGRLGVVRLSRKFLRFQTKPGNGILVFLCGAIQGTKNAGTMCTYL